MTFMEIDILPSNGTIAIVVLRDLDFHFQGETFSCYAFVIKNMQTADVPSRSTSTLTAPAVQLLLLAKQRAMHST